MKKILFFMDIILVKFCMYKVLKCDLFEKRVWHFTKIEISLLNPLRMDVDILSLVMSVIKASRPASLSGKD